MTRKAPILSPQKREILLDALRAPSGYELDVAVGTSFSVDLASALLVPMAFALFDTESGDIQKDPVTVLAATRSYAGRIALYCEQGRIAGGAKRSNVLAYLERTLHPVAPPEGGAFHPKIWVLRFRSSDGSGVVHRLLCLSRNLTFDRSWDTILRLEEAEVGDAGKTAPLISFLGALDEFSPSEEARSLVASLAGVAFKPPPGFVDFELLPMLGDSDARSVPDPLSQGGDGLLVLSPFLAESRLESAIRKWGRVHVASRAASLDRIEPTLLRDLAGVFEFDPPESGSADSEPDMEIASEELGEAVGLSGLHAKVHSGVRGHESFLVVGSANATQAAFHRNVEFCVELRAGNRIAGPRYLLQGGDDPSRLRTLLREYDILDSVTEEGGEERELQRLENLRREIADAHLEVEVIAEPGDGDDLSLVVRAEEPIPPLGAGDRLTCWPITLASGQGVKVGVAERVLAEFRMGRLSLVSGLICFRLESKRKGVPSVEFTLLAKVTGDVDGRIDAVMSEILENPERLMRFLFLLLSAGGEEVVPPSFDFDPDGRRNGHGSFGSSEFQLPLLETLLRTFARDRDRLEAFDDALRSLRRLSDRGEELPAGLLEMWKPIEQALVAEGTKR